MENQLDIDTAIEFIEGLEGMAILDTEGRYTFVSHGWMRYTGYSAEDALGKRVDAIIPETHALEVLQMGRPVFGQRVQKQNVDAFTSYFPRFASDGSISGCFLYIIIHGMEDAYMINKQIMQLSNQVEYYKSELSKERGARYSIDNIIGQSNAIVQLKKKIIHAARSTSTVLIDGETGSGKELIAHSIHTRSKRSAHNFVRVNCSAIPAELMESEFFGYTSGAFTGASKKGKLGRFALANKGTIFLDEINLLSPMMQPKFLRVLQEKEIDPVGGDKSIPINVRVIATSNVSLEQMVASGDFREDLFYRLNVIHISAPPLRDRKEDIPLLTEHLIIQLNRQLGMVVKGVSPDVMELLQRYEWPGNVRELQNAIEAAMNMTDSPVLHKSNFQRLIHRMETNRVKSKGVKTDQPLKAAMQAFERTIVSEALKSTGENRVQAAKLLGISRTILYEKMNKYHLK